MSQHLLMGMEWCGESSCIAFRIHTMTHSLRYHFSLKEHNSAITVKAHIGGGIGSQEGKGVVVSRAYRPAKRGEGMQLRICL